MGTMQRNSIIYLGTVFLLMLLIDCNAQEAESKRMAKSKVSSTEIDFLLDSAEMNMDKDIPQAYDYVKKALENSISSGDKYSEAKSYVMLGKSNNNLKQYDLSINYYQKALLYSSYFNNLELAEIYHGLALAQEKSSNESMAEVNFKIAIKHAKQAENVQKEVAIRYDLARIYVSGKKSDRALAEYEAIQQVEKQRNNKQGVAYANSSKGEVYLLNDEPEKAIANYKEAERIADETKDVELKSSLLRKQGKVYRKSQQYDQELQVRQKSLELNKELEKTEELAEDNLMIGEIYLETQQPSQAMPYIERSIAISTKSGDFKSKGKALKKLSEAYDQQGDYNKALFSYKQYAETIDSVYAQRERKLEDNLNLVADVSGKLQRIELIEQDYEITKKTLVLLEKEQRVSSRELKTQKGLNYTLIIIAFGLALASLLIYRSSLQKRKANLLLALRSLRSQMNPHFIFNSLNSVNSFIASNDERMANKFLSDFSRLMRLVMENSKHDFVPVVSELEVIRLYLKLEHSRFSEKFDYTLEEDEQLQSSNYSVPPMLIQPYIENAIWHGLRYKQDKGKLIVDLKLENNELIAIISDDGIGRKKSVELKTKHQKSNTSTGMKNTKSRLEIINNVYSMDFKVEIDDLDRNNGTGTIVKLRIPLTGQEIVDE